MRPVNQLPLSLTEMKRSPLASSHRHADSPPKPGKREVSTSPPRYSSAPKRTRWGSRGSKEGIGRALTSIATGAVTDYGLSLGLNPSPGACAPTSPTARGATELVASSGADFIHPFSRVQPAPVAVGGGDGPMGLAEQFGELFGDGAAEFFGVDDGDGAAVVAGDVVADADRDQLNRRAGLDFLDDVAEMALQVIAGIDRQRGIIDRRAVGNHHQDLAALGAAQQPLVRPVQRLAVDVLLEQALAHHQAQILARAPPRRVGGFVDDVAEIVEPAGIGRLAGGKPRLARLPALPGAGGEAQNLHLDAAALQRPRQDIGAGRRYRNGAP